MAKKNLEKKQDQVHEHDEACDFDFSEFMDSSPSDNEAFSGIIGHLVDASMGQMDTALELTKLIVEKNSGGDEKAILAIFEQASKAVTKNFPLKALWDNLG